MKGGHADIARLQKVVDLAEVPEHLPYAKAWPEEIRSGEHVEGVFGSCAEANPESPIVDADISVRAGREQLDVFRRRGAACAYKPLISVNQMQRVAVADTKKRPRDLVDHFGALLRRRIKPKDEWTRLVLLHHPVMHRDFIHAWNLDPVIVIRDRQQLARQLLVGDALCSDDKTYIWWQREQLVEEVIELVDAPRVAPHMVESINNDVEPLRFDNQVGCDNPEVGSQLVGVFRNAGHGFGMAYIKLIHQRG